MGKKAAKRSSSGRRASKRRAARWLGLALLAAGLFLFASLLTFVPVDGELHPGPLAPHYANLCGVVGRWCASVSLTPLGWLVVWAVPFLFFGLGVNRLRGAGPKSFVLRLLVATPLVGVFLAVLAGAGAGPRWSGSFGFGLWEVVRSTIGPVGGLLCLITAGLGLALVEAEMVGPRGQAVVRALGRLVGRGLAWCLSGLASLPVLAYRAIADTIGRRREAALQASAAEAAASPVPANALAPAAASRVRTAREMPAEPPPRPRIVDPLTESEGGGLPQPLPAVASARGAESAAATRTDLAPGADSVRPAAPPNSGARSAPAPAPPAGATPTPVAGSGVAPPAITSPSNGNPARNDKDAVIVRAVPEGTPGADDVEGSFHAAQRASRKPKSSQPTPRALFSTVRGKYVPPSPSLLTPAPEHGPPVPETELMENSRILTETLRDFGVSGRVGEVHPGPVITRYEFTPGPGVRVAQILNRQDDLALKLRAIRIRIVAPIPGKAAVGIEVPNHNPVTIHLRQILESKPFTEPKGPLPLALGKDINGFPVVTEMTRMPHLLIAGTTGSGKSVCVNGIITSLVAKNGPADLRLLMIDPKMLELPMYNGIPHLLTDVVTDPKLAARSLKWLLLEMERRYKVLAARGSRNIQSYNDKLAKDGAIHEGEEHLPYIVVLIDELADLMITSGNEVEEPIGRLAQTARAVGIHLIVATQRPSVDVITGVIKANFPSRIGFQVASRTDSRTILDQNGAETLLGRGDMLFLPPGTGTPMRVHGAYVSESETQDLVKFIKEQGIDTGTDLSLEEALAENEARTEDLLGDDPRFEDAARLVVAAGQGSASLLQRRLKVGYARAGRLVDMLESAGVVAPAEGSKPRDVLVDQVLLEQMLRERDA